MIFTSRMVKLIALVRESDTDEVTRELLKQGVMDFVSISSLKEEIDSRISPVTPLISLGKIETLYNRLQGLYGIIHYQNRKDALRIEDFHPLDLDESEILLDKISAEIRQGQEKQKALQSEIIKLKEIQRQFELYGSLGPGLPHSSPYSFLSIQTGSIPEVNMEPFRGAMENLPVVYTELKGKLSPVILLITIKKDKERVNSILAGMGWTDILLPLQDTGEAVIEDANRKLGRLEEQQTRLALEIEEAIKGEQTNLDRLYKELSLNKLYYTIQTRFSKTEKTVLFSGWLPAGKKKLLEDGIKKAAGRICYLEWREAETKKGEDVPVEMRNPSFMKPFQTLVENYSIPQYGTIDPTPLVLISFLVMFALMFGDAGHGAILLLSGIIGTITARKKGKKGVLFPLIIWCGGSSIISGVLFGSYFGFPLLPSLWFDYHEVVLVGKLTGPVHSIYDILTITIYFGITIIAAGLLLNWINCFRKRRWLSLFFSKGGILGGWLYGGGVYTSFYYVHHGYKGFPSDGLLLLIILLPACLFIVKPVIETFLHPEKKGKHKIKAGTIFKVLIEWMVELLEIFSGYLANTLSFMRVAGLGIAHVSLMAAFFSIANMVSPKGLGTPLAIIVLLLGNILVILLEGLSAGIQSLRLNYYEFFSKYYSPGGRVYRPISLINKE